MVSPVYAKLGFSASFQEVLRQSSGEVGWSDVDLDWGLHGKCLRPIQDPF